MKKNKIIFWVSTGFFSFAMFFSAISYFTNAEIKAAFAHLGFPAYFRIELGITKMMGVLALIVPQVPARVKEWAYAGFGINCISASIAHFASGDPASGWVPPLVLFGILVVSYIYNPKQIVG